MGVRVAHVVERVFGFLRQVATEHREVEEKLGVHVRPEPKEILCDQVSLGAVRLVNLQELVVSRADQRTRLELPELLVDREREQERRGCVVRCAAGQIHRSELVVQPTSSEVLVDQQVGEEVDRGEAFEGDELSFEQAQARCGRHRARVARVVPHLVSQDRFHRAHEILLGDHRPAHEDLSVAQVEPRDRVLLFVDLRTLEQDRLRPVLASRLPTPDRWPLRCADSSRSQSTDPEVLRVDARRCDEPRGRDDDVLPRRHLGKDELLLADADLRVAHRDGHGAGCAALVREVEGPRHPDPVVEHGDRELVVATPIFDGDDARRDEAKRSGNERRRVTSQSERLDARLLKPLRFVFGVQALEHGDEEALLATHLDRSKRRAQEPIDPSRVVGHAFAEVPELGQARRGDHRGVLGHVLEQDGREQPAAGGLGELGRVDRTAAERLDQEVHVRGETVDAIVAGGGGHPGTQSWTLDDLIEELGAPTRMASTSFGLGSLDDVVEVHRHRDSAARGRQRWCMALSRIKSSWTNPLSS